MTNINDFLNKRMSKKEFIKIFSLGITGAVLIKFLIASGLLNQIFKKEDLNNKYGLSIKGNKIYLKGKEIIEVTESAS